MVVSIEKGAGSHDEGVKEDLSEVDVLKLRANLLGSPVSNLPCLLLVAWGFLLLLLFLVACF